jgi:hypothetical protein
MVPLGNRAEDLEATRLTVECAADSHAATLNYGCFLAVIAGIVRATVTEGVQTDDIPLTRLQRWPASIPKMVQKVHGQRPGGRPARGSVLLTLGLVFRDDPHGVDYARDVAEDRQ